jgi:glycosyltransferase involved in cell wall biosynthesis
VLIILLPLLPINWRAVLHFLVKHKTTVIPLGLYSTTYLNACTEKLVFWHNRFGPRFFLFIGVIRYYKELHILVEAARNLEYPIIILGASPVEAELKAHVD